MRTIAEPKLEGGSWRERTVNKLRTSIMRSHYAHLMKSALDGRDDVTAEDLAKELNCALTVNELSITFTSPLYGMHNNVVIGGGAEQVKKKRKKRETH